MGIRDRKAAAVAFNSQRQQACVSAIRAVKDLRYEFNGTASLPPHFPGDPRKGALEDDVAGLLSKLLH